MDVICGFDRVNYFVRVNRTGPISQIDLFLKYVDNIGTKRHYIGPYFTAEYIGQCRANTYTQRYILDW